MIFHDQLDEAFFYFSMETLYPYIPSKHYSTLAELVIEWGMTAEEACRVLDVEKELEDCGPLPSDIISSTFRPMC